MMIAVLLFGRQISTSHPSPGLEGMCAASSWSLYVTLPDTADRFLGACNGALTLFYGLRQGML
jgi:hypothetical protein